MKNETNLSDSELKELLEGLQTFINNTGKFPKTKELQESKNFRLINLVYKSKVKFRDFAKMLNIETEEFKRGHWNEETLTEEIRQICEKEGGWPNKYQWGKEYSNIKNAAFKCNSLKYFREKLGIKHSAGVKEKECLNCGKLFRPEVSCNGSRQKYCSEECHINYGRLKQNEKNALNRNQLKCCPICNKEFIPQNTIKQKYCQRSCFTNFRKRLVKALTRCCEHMNMKKYDYTHNILGYSSDDLLKHLESFPNWAELKDKKWHLDHIFPIKAFLDRGIKDIKLICCLENLQPISDSDNLSKSCKFNEKEFDEWLIKKGHHHLILC